MAQNVTVASLRTRIRQRADVETADQANSIVTTDELDTVINEAYRALYDIIANHAGPHYYATSASVSPSSFTLPADFYRALGVDLPNFWGTSRPYSLRRFSFAERNRRAGALFAAGYDPPTYRIEGGVIRWEPTSAAPTSAVTLWYIPTPAALATGGSFDGVNGWDEFVVCWGVRYVKEKQEEDSGPAILKLREAEARVRESAGRIVQDPVTVADVRGDCYDSYFNS